MGITFLVSTILLKSFLEQIDKWSKRNQSLKKKGELKSTWHRLYLDLCLLTYSR